MKGNKLKMFSVFALFLVALLAISVVRADSVPVSIEKVYLNDREIENNEIRGDLVRDNRLDVEVKLLANGSDEHVKIEATVEGLDHDEDEATDETDVFTVEAGKTYYEKMSIKLPARMDADEEYALRIEVSNRKDDEVVYNARLYVETVRNGIMIKDVVFSPENAVKAGRSLLTTLRLKNIGEEDEEDVKVSVSIPDLALSASDYLDEVEAEDTVTSEELYLRIPNCADAGEYDVIVKVEFDEGDEFVTSAEKITIVENEICSATSDEEAGKTVIAVSSEAQDVKAGASGVVYPLTISNTGSESKTYTISSTAGEWAEMKVSPSVVVLGAGEAKVVYVYVSAVEDAEEGMKSFVVSVKSGEKTLKEVAMQANVLEGSSGFAKLKKGLEVALVVLVVLLVIIGLIIGFNRLRGNEEDDELKEDTQTYY